MNSNKYKLVPSSKFRKDLKGYLKNKKEIVAIKDCLDLLAKDGYKNIPAKRKPHQLSGNYKDCWECHILPDLLLIWEQEDEPINEVYLLRIGSHSNLF